MRITATRLSGGALVLPLPVTLECSCACDIPADSFYGVFPALGLAPCGELATLRMELDGLTVFDGLVDEQTLSKNSGGVFLTIKARGRACMLLDNEAVPQMMYRANLWDIYNKCAKQYGFEGIVYSSNPTLSSFVIAKGQSEWQALDSFCKQALGVSPYISGNYIVAKSRPAGRPLLFSNTAAGGTALSAVQVCNKRYPVISKVILKSESRLYDTAVTNPEAEHLQIKRKRYISPPKDWGGNLRTGAEQLIRSSMLKKLLVTVTLPSLTRVDPGDRVTVTDSAASYSGLMAHEVTYRASGAGFTTTVALVLPDYTG